MSLHCVSHNHNYYFSETNALREDSENNGIFQINGMRSTWNTAYAPLSLHSKSPSLFAKEYITPRAEPTPIANETNMFFEDSELNIWLRENDCNASNSFIPTSPEETALVQMPSARITLVSPRHVSGEESSNQPEMYTISDQVTN
jgi:hypothetical protein